MSAERKWTHTAISKINIPGKDLDSEHCISKDQPCKLYFYQYTCLFSETELSEVASVSAACPSALVESSVESSELDVALFVSFLSLSASSCSNEYAIHKATACEFMKKTTD